MVCIYVSSFNYTFYSFRKFSFLFIFDSLQDPVALRRQRAQRKAQHKGKTQIKHEEDDGEIILGHSFNDLEFGRGEEFLTLADKPILKAVGSDQYDIDEDEDEIESIALREKEKRKHNAEIKAGKVCSFFFSICYFLYSLLFFYSFVLIF